MDTHIPDPYVTLDPADPSQHDLCQLVVEETHAYLRWQPLPRFWDAFGNPMTHEKVLEYGSTVIKFLTREFNGPWDRYVGSTSPVTIEHACKDWTARHAALRNHHTVRHPAYFAVLDELLSDLVRPAYRPVHEQAALYVAIVVRYPFSMTALRRTRLTATCGLQAFKDTSGNVHADGACAQGLPAPGTC